MVTSFGENIERNTQQDLPIDVYFNKKEKTLKRIIPILSEEALDVMEDLICDDKEDFDDLVKTINEHINEQIEENKDNDDVETPKLLTKKEIKRLEIELKDVMCELRKNKHVEKKIKKKLEELVVELENFNK